MLPERMTLIMVLRCIYIYIYIYIKKKKTVIVCGLLGKNWLWLKALVV